MDQFTVEILALGLSFIAYKTGARLFYIASAIVFIYLLFDSRDPLLMLAFAAVAIYEFYIAILGKD